MVGQITVMKSLWIKLVTTLKLLRIVSYCLWKIVFDKKIQGILLKTIPSICFLDLETAFYGDDVLELHYTDGQIIAYEWIGDGWMAVYIDDREFTNAEWLDSLLELDYEEI